MYTQIPYFNLPDTRRRGVMPPPPIAMPDEEEAAAAAYQLPSFSRPQAEDPRTAGLAQRAGIPTDPDIPELNTGATEEILPVRPSLEIPHYALPARSPVGGDALGIKRAAGDYSSEPAASNIKVAAGVPVSPPIVEHPLPVRPSIDIPRFAMPAQPSGAAAVSIPESLPPGAPAPNVPTPPMFTPQPPPRVAGTGWKGHLAALGKGALYGMGMGGQQGGMGAIGGAIAGAITGAASPKTIARWDTEGDEAKWRQTHALEEQDAKNESTRRNTEDDNARDWERLRQSGVTTKMAQETHAIDVKERARHNQVTEGEKSLNDFWTRFPGKATPKELAEAAGHPYLAGYVPTLKSSGRAGPVHDINGVPSQQNPQTGVWEPVDTPGGAATAKTDYQGMNYNLSKERFDEEKKQHDLGERKDEERRITDAEGALRKAQGAINYYRRLAAQGTRKPGDANDKRLTAEELDQEKANALAVIDELVGSHPDLLEGGEGDHGFPYAKWKGGKRPTPTVVAAPRMPAGGSSRRSIDEVKAAARADVKRAGETPAAIQAFERWFKEKYQ